MRIAKIKTGIQSTTIHHINLDAIASFWMERDEVLCITTLEPTDWFEHEDDSQGVQGREYYLYGEQARKAYEFLTKDVIDLTVEEGK